MLLHLTPEDVAERPKTGSCGTPSKGKVIVVELLHQRFYFANKIEP